MYKDVEVLEIQNLEILNMSDDVVEIMLEVEVENPNSFKVKLIDADIDVFLNEKDMGKLKLGDTVILPKKSKSVQKLKILADAEKIQKNILSNALSFLFAKSADLKAQGTVKGKALGIGKKVDINFERKIDMDDIDLGF